MKKLKLKLKSDSISNENYSEVKRSLQLNDYLKTKSMIAETPEISNSSNQKRFVNTFITVDAEWDSKSNQWLSTQILVKKGSNKYLSFFVWEDIPNKVTMKEYCKSKGISFYDLPNTDNILSIIINRGCIDKAHLRFFYSLKDIQYMMSKEEAKEIFMKKLEKKRNVRGCFTYKSKDDFHKVTLHCKDTSGWTNSSLSDLAAAVGVKMMNKSSMDKYKKNMLKGAEENPIDFVKYAMGDVTELDEIFDKFPELIKWVEVDILGIPEKKAFTIQDIPMTVGSIVAKTFEKFMISRSSNPELFKLAIRKVGILKPNDNEKKRKKDLEAFKWLNKKWSTKDLSNQLNNELCKHILEEAKFEQLAYSAANIPTLARKPYKESTYCFNAIVQGGRCNNEIPTEVSVPYALDIDLQSCYGSSLRTTNYPIGLPTKWGFTPNEERITLREFLRKNEKKLEPGLWQITVSGILSFSQDLIFSKDVKGSDINKAVSSNFSENKGDTESEDKSHIPGVFCLLRKEIVNGIITTDILKAIRKVATNKELKEILDLEVVCAIGYLKKYKCETEEEFISKVLAAPNCIYKAEDNEIKDKRAKYWFSIPLEEFIGKLVDKRTKLKKQGKEGDEEANCKQDILKLFINTLYGDFASPYFPIGNVILANNITAKARLGAWMMAKALVLRQTITDGGIYSPLKVASFSSRKPGFEILSNMKEWADWKKERYIKPLGGVDWIAKFEEFKSVDDKNIQKCVDEVASNHIEQFWEPYDLSLKSLFHIEHKVKNTASKAAYINKGHYALQLLKPKEEPIIYSVRGSKLYDEEDLVSNPTYQLLHEILDEKEYSNIRIFEYDHKHLISLPLWQQAQKSVEGFQNIKDKMPGDEIIETRVMRLNNHYFPVETMAEYKSRINRKKTIKGVTIKFYDRYLIKQSILSMINLMENNNRNNL